MRTLIASAILISGSAFAHDTHISTDSCDLDLNAGLTIKDNVVSFTKHDKTLYKIYNDQTLVVDGDEVALDSSQQALVTQYSTQIRQVVPEVKVLASDAIDLAIEGVNLAFNELLGEGNNVAHDLTVQLNAISEDIDQTFDANNFSIDEHGTLQGDFFGEAFEQRIEGLVEETVKNSMGTLLIAVGQEMLFSGGNMEAFETRMEDFGTRIEQEMEARAEKLEGRAEALCQSVKAIDELEEQLKSSIEEMPKTDVLRAEVSAHNKA